MKNLFLILLAGILTGCVATHATLPSLEGKPRIKINQQEPRSATPAQNTNDTKGE